MGRIPEAELERLKAEVSVQRLAEARGVELRRHGRDLLGLCPFHEDHEPSLVISPAKNLWHCLGACQAGGSAIDWVMRERGVSFRHAVELLRADLPFAAEGMPVRGATVRMLPAPVAMDAADGELLAQVAAYYHATLHDSPEAQAYLASRGLDDAELVSRFQLGFANRTLGLRLPLGNRRSGAEIRTRLQRLGILRASGHEHLNGSVTVPLLDPSGAVVGMYGRKISAGLRAGTPLHLYLPGPHRGVWNEAGIAAADGEGIVCEALIDGLTAWRLGVTNVTSAYGIEGFTAEHLEALQRHGVRRVLIAYDRDPAGDRAAVQLAVRLVAAGIDCFRVQLPQGEDINSFACADMATAPERLAARLRAAVWLGQGSPPPAGQGGADTPRGAAKEGAPLHPFVDESSAPAAVPRTTTTAPEPAAETSPDRPPSPVCSPLPPPPPREDVGELRGDELVLCLGDRHWRVRGLGKTTSFDSLRVNLLVHRGEQEATAGAPFHVDTLDLYAARQRAQFASVAAAELGIAEDVVRHDLGTVLLRCEALATDAARRATDPTADAVVLSDDEQREALALLRDPALLDRILEGFERCGVVGEETNKLLAYLAATSRLLDSPLAVIIQSTSAAGKSALLDAVLALLPAEARSKYSAMTGQSLYYMGGHGRRLEHTVLAVVEEEGAERATYALKLLQSEGELRIASTGKDASSGRLVTHEYAVSGPVALFLTTTAVDVDDELLNRCIVLSVDEEREQTRAIHERQRQAETLAGLLAARERERITTLHHNAQRLLRPLLVANPFAEQLTFADQSTRSRRDHRKYLTLIRTVTLLHQHQREHHEVIHGGERIEYIEVTREDIAVANRLADAVLGRSLDELPPQTRRLLLLLDEYVSARSTEQEISRADVRFRRRELREWSGWGDTQLKCHLRRLLDLEYLGVTRASSGPGLLYELLWDGRGRAGERCLSGLLDAAVLPPGAHGYDGSRAGAGSDRAGPGRPPVGPRSGGGRPDISAAHGNGHQENGATPAHSPRPRTTRDSRPRPHVVPAEADAEPLAQAAQR